MENNKFNKFYSKKPTSELIKQLRSHLITNYKLDKEWYEALKIHLSKRDLSINERKIVEHILSTDPSILKTEEGQDIIIDDQSIRIDDQQKNHNNSNFEINPSNFIKAGRSIKGVVYVVLIMIICNVLGVLFAINSNDFELKNDAYMFIGLVSLVSNIIILFQLFSAGNNIETSVKFK